MHNKAQTCLKSNSHILNLKVPGNLPNSLKRNVHLVHNDIIKQFVPLKKYLVELSIIYSIKCFQYLHSQKINARKASVLLELLQ